VVGLGQGNFFFVEQFFFLRRAVFGIRDAWTEGLFLISLLYQTPLC
jgi:hypothetical protein